MKKALTSAVVSIAMIASSVSSIAADSASSNSTPAAQTGPLSPGGPVTVSPAQGTVYDQLSCGYYDIYGICGPVVLLGVAGMGVALAAIMGAFSSSKITSTITTTVSTTGTGG